MLPGKRPMKRAILTGATSGIGEGQCPAFDCVGSRSTGAAGCRRLFDGHWIGRRKGVLEGLVERLLPASTLVTFVSIRYAFWIGNHFDTSDRCYMGSFPPRGKHASCTVAILGQ